MLLSRLQLAYLTDLLACGLAHFLESNIWRGFSKSGVKHEGQEMTSKNWKLFRQQRKWSIFTGTLAQRTPKPMQQSRSFSPHSMSLSALIAPARSMSVSWSSPPKLSTQTRQEWMMEITRHARPPTVSTAPKDKVVCLMPRRKRKVATSRRASRADYVIGHVVQSASGKVVACDWTITGKQILVWGC